jgi:hypothetical protein
MIEHYASLLRVPRRVLWVGCVAALSAFALAANADMPPPPAACALHLAVTLTPDVPDPSDSGFISSLLNDHSAYRLTLQQVRDSNHLDLQLYGPGTDHSCSEVVGSIRKDARVQSVQVL